MKNKKENKEKSTRTIIVEKYDKYKTIINTIMMILGGITLFIGNNELKITGILAITLFKMANEMIVKEVEEEEIEE